MIVGAAWKEKDKDGKGYLSVSIDMGILGKKKLSIYPVKPEDKKNENYPDYRVVWYSPEEKEKWINSNASSQKTEKQENESDSPFEDDDIPF